MNGSSITKSLPFSVSNNNWELRKWVSSLKRNPPLLSTLSSSSVVCLDKRRWPRRRPSHRCRRPSPPDESFSHVNVHPDRQQRNLARICNSRGLCLSLVVASAENCILVLPATDAKMQPHHHSLSHLCCWWCWWWTAETTLRIIRFANSQCLRDGKDGRHD